MPLMQSITSEKEPPVNALKKICYNRKIPCVSFRDGALESYNLGSDGQECTHENGYLRVL
uniref:Uncharacterized protein n=1 Tax=Setaria digitata TaxID=48799 RepID=A0A915PYW0_9BILA